MQQGSTNFVEPCCMDLQKGGSQNCKQIPIKLSVHIQNLSDSTELKNNNKSWRCGFWNASNKNPDRKRSEHPHENYNRRVETKRIGQTLWSWSKRLFCPTGWEIRVVAVATSRLPVGATTTPRNNSRRVVLHPPPTSWHRMKKSAGNKSARLLRSERGSMLFVVPNDTRTHFHSPFFFAIASFSLCFIYLFFCHRCRLWKSADFNVFLKPLYVYLCLCDYLGRNENRRLLRHISRITRVGLIFLYVFFFRPVTLSWRKAQMIFCQSDELAKHDPAFLSNNSELSLFWELLTHCVYFWFHPSITSISQ